MKYVHLFCLVSILGTASSAQGTLWTVGEGGGAGVDFPDLGSAVAAAASGDAILVRPGTYEGIAAIDAKSLAVIAEPGAMLLNFPQAQATFSPTLSVANLAADQRVLVLGGFYSGHESLGSDVGPFQVETSTGPVWFQDVTARGRFGVDVYHSSSVHLVDAAFEGTRTVFELFFGPTGDALRAAGFSRSAAWNSQLDGALGQGGACNPSVVCQPPAYHGGNGVRLRENASLWASGSALVGGFGGDGGTVCAPGWADGTGGDGGHGAELEDASRLEATDSLLVGGNGGNGGCTGEAGLPVIGPGTASVSAAAARSLSSTSPVREGETSQLVFTGVEGDFVFGLASPNPMYLDVPGFTGPLAVGAPFNLQPVDFLPASGELALELSIDDLPDGFDFLVRFLQPLFVTAEGEFVLGAPTALVVLDETF